MADLATTAPAPPAGVSLLDRKKKMPTWVSGAIVLVALIGGLGYIGFHVAGDLGNATLGSIWPYLLLGTALLIALGFEFVNGFHDTANAVATVIYTHSLDPNIAVVWSGLCNLTGVLTSAGGVAFTIITLLPVELILKVSSGAGFAMVFALLLSAIIWNVGTWYLGLPASSSHTLIGSIVGVGLMNSLMSSSQQFGEGVNWGKVQDTAMALLVSPVIGFVAAGLLLLAAKAVISNPALYQAPEGKAPPPLWIRALLVLTCTGVSFAHGSNDGQKGMGLIMLILIGVVPATYALNLATSSASLQSIVAASQAAQPIFGPAPSSTDAMASQVADAELSRFLTTGKPTPQTMTSLAVKNGAIAATLGPIKSISELPVDGRSRLRRDVYLVEEGVSKLTKAGAVPDARNKATSSGSVMCWNSAFRRRIATLVSRSGGSRSAISPHSKRE